jgi:hypothetical protein
MSIAQAGIIPINYPELCLNIYQPSIRGPRHGH